jgi:hypothetical protein
VDLGCSVESGYPAPNSIAWHRRTGADAGQDSEVPDQLLISSGIKTTLRAPKLSKDMCSKGGVVLQSISHLPINTGF